METKRNLPAITELYDEVILREKDNAFNMLMNKPPKQEWIKVHPMTKGSYLPIERVEYLLTRIFINWKVEILDSKLIGNSVVVTVRLHYKSVTSGEWEWQDGIGASPLQTDKEAGAIEFNKLKSGAVQMAAPSAETYAIKDAAEKLGRLFGKDLNRKDVMNYEALSGTFDTKEKALKSAKKKIIDALDTYKGKDKEELRTECGQREAANNFTWKFIEETAKKLKITL